MLKVNVPFVQYYHKPEAPKVEKQKFRNGSEKNHLFTFLFSEKKGMMSIN